MIGDRLVVTEYHRAGAATVFGAIRPRLDGAAGPLAVCVCGESGSGKTEIAHCLADRLANDGKIAVILGQDDYFRLPPKTNHAHRMDNLSWVGPREVRLDLLDEHIAALKQAAHEPLAKPLVHFDEDRIAEETIRFDELHVIIAEGTYTGLLEQIDVRAFIDRDYRQTKKVRLKRARDPDVAFLERVLSIEHDVIATQKDRADVIIDAPEEERSDLG